MMGLKMTYLPARAPVACGTDACPHLAQSGHQLGAEECPLLRVKRTSTEGTPMSANDPERTWRDGLLDYLVGASQDRRGALMSSACDSCGQRPYADQNSRKRSP